MLRPQAPVAGWARRYRLTQAVVTTMVVAADLIALVAGTLLAFWLAPKLTGFAEPIYPYGWVAVLISANFFLLRLARRSYDRPMGRGQDSDQGVVYAFLVAALMVGGTTWSFDPAPHFPTALAAGYIAGCTLFLFTSRYAVRQIVWQLVQAGKLGQRIIIYGAETETAERAIRLLELERLPYLSVVGIADARTSRVPAEAPWGLPHYAGMEELRYRLGRGDIDMVLIALPNISQGRLDELTEALQSISVDVCLMPREAMDLSSQYNVRFIGSLPLFALWQRPIREWGVMVKALEDRTLAAAGLIILSPVMIVTAILIKLSSPGPILFRQQRFGFNNVKIEVLKFRSMRTELQDPTGTDRTVRGDPRVTWIGRIIRRLSIDELPQLINVMRGEMSLVGPRPHATTMMVGDDYYFDAVRHYTARHRVKPGITGLAQVRGLRGEIDSVERAKRRVELDFYYIENWSLMLDIRIILETIFKIWRDPDAY
ncbi:exopolysaccharide biosynthesis polyprenyl glycosylphosphotransferase [Sphingomonas crocodyli]|uniref:Exopolysaccharide biosynthesis polyprenyl glycosylphosphotransferase n=1 Tax=Sphingomonas crocodyli TaxID=1979270 RepID=A0A437MB52_9SPHN|nr:exopolysaccharide biosynthesis polyprenyl glycosylphosphotransferase [Sphingomonas crocodyli]RVT94862.1 exopolysaccharide biosynthesis polyprenyl glycosylphosphotransferase [Sphingomonas crocodyli]